MMNRDTGAPTQQEPETLETHLAEIDRATREAREIYSAAAALSRRLIGDMELIAGRIERSVRRLEIARQMMRPAVPIVKPTSDLPCKGEEMIMRALFAEGGETDPDTLMRRTGYAPSTLRTYLPMLRRRGLVHQSRLALVDFPVTQTNS